MIECTIGQKIFHNNFCDVGLGVKIKDHYAPADFMVLDMEEEDDSPIILGRPFLNTTNAVIYIGSRQIHL
jgi:hypothetical protein